MNYHIVATLGPASADEGTWRSLLAAGATAFRLNTAHFQLETLESWLSRIARFREQSGGGSSAFSSEDGSPSAQAFPVILDLQASKWRIGSVETTELPAGARVQLIPASEQAIDTDAAGTPSQVLPVPHPDFFAAAEIAGSGEIAVNDARVMLGIETLEKQRITARVLRGGEISAGKGITIVGSSYRKEQLNQKDTRIAELARSYSFVRYALSYVKDAVEMNNYRRLFSDREGDAEYLIAKLERASALEEAEQIARIADELWICRGDLGAEMGAAAMAEQLFRFFPRIRDIGEPVFLAGQVLEHMTAHPTPTRSEISYLYEALQRGVQGLVLSDETAVGAYPLEACRAAAMFRSR
jgi:pyruvate kinase